MVNRNVTKMGITLSVVYNNSKVDRRVKLIYTSNPVSSYTVEIRSSCFSIVKDLSKFWEGSASFNIITQNIENILSKLEKIS